MLTVSLLIIFGIAVVAATVLFFEIMMIVDAVKNPKLSENERVLWVLGMLLIHPVVAIAYYFAAHSRLSRP